MLEHLFGSKTRFKLLKYFYRDPTKSFFVRELTRALDAHIHAVRRELGLLTQLGIVKEVEAKDPKKASSKPGGSLRKYYTLNVESPVFEELQGLLMKSQVLGEEKFIKEIQEKAGEIKLFLVTGRFTGDCSIQTDLLLIGDVKPRILEKIIKKYEKEFGFDIRYTIMAEGEYRDRRYIMDRFLYSIFEAKHVMVINHFEF